MENVNIMAKTPNTKPAAPVATVNTLEIVDPATGWTAGDDVVAENHIVTDFSVAPAKGDTRYIVRRCRLDFADMDRGQLMTLAAKSVVISIQRMFRTSFATNRDNATNPATWAQFNVWTDIVNAERAAVDPFARAKSAVTKLTAEQRAELARMLDAAERADRAAAKTAAKTAA